MIRRPPRSTRTDTLFPYTTLFRSAAASAVRSKLLRLKDAEKIFCPLTAPNIWELRKQAGASLYRTAELMEQLSENGAFRQLDQLASNEGDVFFAYLLGRAIRQIGINGKFATLLRYLYRKSVVQGKSVSVRVDLGGRR